LTIEDQNGDLIPVKIDDNRDGTYHVTYQPKDPGTYHVEIVDTIPPTLSTMTISKIPPLNVVIDASQTIAYGPSLGLSKTTPLWFKHMTNMTTISQGGQDEAVVIKGPKGAVTADLRDNNDGTYTVGYTISDKGEYINVTVNGTSVCGSPFSQTVVKVKQTNSRFYVCRF